MTWANFKREDFACKCGCGTNLIEDEFIDKLQLLRDDCGFPLPVNSGYRCPARNAAVSSTGATGPHTTGKAGDLGVDRERAVIVMEKALAIPYFRGFGVSQKGPTAGRFIHLDAIARATRTIWSY